MRGVRVPKKTAPVSVEMSRWRRTNVRCGYGRRARPLEPIDSHEPREYCDPKFGVGSLNMQRALRWGSWLWPVVGIVLLGGWVFGAAFAFLSLLRILPDGMTVETLGLLSWQFVIVLVAVPVLGLVMIGGLKMLGYAVTIRELLKELPEQVQTLDQLSKVTEKSGDQIERSKAAMTEAAGTLDEAMSQLADFESRLAQLSNGGAQVTAAKATRQELVERLIRHLDQAKKIFDDADILHAQKSGAGVERVRGWILDSSVAELQAAGALPPMVAAYIFKALEVDRKTRRAGRSNLDPADLAALDALEAGATYKKK